MLENTSVSHVGVWSGDFTVDYLKRPRSADDRRDLGLMGANLSTDEPTPKAILSGVCETAYSFENGNIRVDAYALMKI